MVDIINNSNLKTTTDHLDYDDTFHTSLLGSDTCLYLRFWELDHYAVILGRNNNASIEVNEQVCSDVSIPIIKRSSGGGTVLLGPGCLCYSLFIPTSHPSCSTIPETNTFVMNTHKEALQPFSSQILVQGVTDLTINSFKFSGNAQRRKRDFILFHGTFLYNFDLSMISTCLQFPSKAPEYRKHRSHENFVQNIAISKDNLVELLLAKWNLY